MVIGASLGGLVFNFFHVFCWGGLPFAEVAALLILAFHPVMKDLTRQPNNTKLVRFETVLGVECITFRTLDFKLALVIPDGFRTPDVLPTQDDRLSNRFFCGVPF